MTRTLLNGILVPILIWSISNILLLFYLPLKEASQIASYVLIYAILLSSWWFIAFARWLRTKIRFESISYLLSNLVVSLIPLAACLSIITNLRNPAETFAGLLFIVASLFGTGWFGLSVIHLLRTQKERHYQGIFWHALESTSAIWCLWPSSPRREGELSFAIAIPQELRVEKFDTARHPLFKRIPAKATPNRVRDDAKLLSEPVASAVPTEATDPSEPILPCPPNAQEMTATEQHWYILWRRELEAGHFLPTDLKYLLIYANEVINLVGFDRPQAALDRLVAFWQHYRIAQPELDAYLVDWLADFLVVHQLPMPPLEWYNQVTEQGVKELIYA